MGKNITGTANLTERIVLHFKKKLPLLDFTALLLTLKYQKKDKTEIKIPVFGSGIF